MDATFQVRGSFEVDCGSHDFIENRHHLCLHKATGGACEEPSRSPRAMSTAFVLGERENSSDGSSASSDSRDEHFFAQGAGNDGISSRSPSLRYTVIDVPPWHVCLILGFQHYLTTLGSTIVIPALLVPAMGGTPRDHARVVQTIFFVSGLNTIIQTTIGDRLPIVQGGSFSFLKPAFSIIAIIKATKSFPSDHDRFLYTMHELQGSIIASSLVVMVIGYSGVMGALLRFVSPIVVAPTVCMVGLSLYSAGFPGVADCVEQGLLSMVAVIMFSQLLKKVEIPMPQWLRSSRAPSSPALLDAAATMSTSSVDVGRAGNGRRHGGGSSRGGDGVRIFELFPLLWSIILSWTVAGILTAAGVYDKTSPKRKASCRTDNLQAVDDAPWVYMPYPLQWGSPTFRPASIVTMLSGALAAVIESTGDYYACARMCGAPVPPPHVISRGIGAEGMGCLMCGLFGTGNGTTSYAENIGAIGLTGVGSRRVVQAGAAIMLVLAIFGKVGGLFASLPSSIVSGLFCCVFGLIAAVGLSNLQFTDQNSSRNLFIVGFAIYMSLSVPYYFESYTSAHDGAGPIATSSHAFNDITNTLLSTPMCAALICAFVMDNSISGTATERGLTHWSTLAAVDARKQAATRGGSTSPSNDSTKNEDDDEDDTASDPRNDPRIKAVYDLPYFLQMLNDSYILPHRRAAHRRLQKLHSAVRWRWRWLTGRIRGFCGCRVRTTRRGTRRSGGVRIPAYMSDLNRAGHPGISSGGAAAAGTIAQPVPYSNLTEAPPYAGDDEEASVNSPWMRGGHTGNSIAALDDAGYSSGAFPGGGGVGVAGVGTSNELSCERRAGIL